MMSKEAKIRQFVQTCDIEVPQSMVDEAFHFMRLKMGHQMRYQAMGSGKTLPEIQEELTQHLDELREDAFFSVKSDLVLKEIIAKENFAVTREELEAEAQAMAQRQNTTVEKIREFFGAELRMLENDVKMQKAMDWICQQV